MSINEEEFDRILGKIYYLIENGKENEEFTLEKIAQEVGCSKEEVEFVLSNYQESIARIISPGGLLIEKRDTSEGEVFYLSRVKDSALEIMGY